MQWNGLGGNEMKSMSFICPQRLFHKFSGLEINACASTCLVCVTQNGSYHSDSQSQWQAHWLFNSSTSSPCGIAACSIWMRRINRASICPTQTHAAYPPQAFCWHWSSDQDVVWKHSTASMVRESTTGKNTWCTIVGTEEVGLSSCSTAVLLCKISDLTQEFKFRFWDQAAWAGKESFVTYCGKKNPTWPLN